ncbi:hypothetical protein [Aquimarina algicola]|uniref:Uncharacterized protein n=1 Tax=Aquimarina algicola TaxID=2589995 RepID=A0A504J5L4_9FLAO|nr:hypothetical protein [Aquimarina algicola]TPN86087.1 hypothetical protein FHK87_12500 [Aquimarina algicola]
MGDDNKSNTISIGIKEILITALLTFLGWIAFSLYSINGELKGINQKVISNVGEIDKLGNIIPEYRERIAMARYRKDIHSAFVTYKPKKDQENKWSMKMAIADFKNDSITYYQIGLDSMKDSFVLSATTGIIKHNYNNAISFKEMERYSEKLKEFKKMSGQVVSQSSYVWEESNQALAAALKVKADSFATYQLGASMKKYDWSELVDIIKEKEELKN